METLAPFRENGIRPGPRRPEASPVPFPYFPWYRLEVGNGHPAKIAGIASLLLTEHTQDGRLNVAIRWEKPVAEEKFGIVTAGFCY
jgi:hypothetical protein